MAYETKTAVAVPDLSREERFPRFVQAALSAGCGAVFTFPLIHGDGCLGALDLYREVPGALEQADLVAAQTLADVTAAYLINATAREEARTASDRFKLSSLHDALTGLPNRALLQERLEHAAQRARRSHSHSAVLYADLDKFKRINDTYGHGVGDEILIAVGERLSHLVRAGDTFARVSGDEFVMLCEDIRSASFVEALAARVQSAFDRPFATSVGELSLTASVGIAFAGPGEEISDQLVSHADIAMYEAKRSGGGAHKIIDLRTANKAMDDDQLVAAFREALASHRLDLAYQPIVRTDDGSLTGVEALLRWANPHRGQVPPMAMIDMAERHGLMDQLGAWVLERACRDHARWVSAHAGPRLELAVNVTAVQLMGLGFCGTVKKILERTGLDPSLLILEMTETIYITDPERALTVLADLKAMKIQLALDDFGTGYSSLSYLRRFPVDIVKIDRSLTAEMGRNGSDGAIVASVVDLAHVLGLDVTVEGVETRAQADGIRSMGSDAAQGFYYSRPLPASAIEGLLARRPLPVHAGAAG
jgi:diguanylate cyclase (GGDEF)-like protein